jgi:ABC-2 type transport system permease protein
MEVDVRGIRFLLALWKAGLAGAMEYRAAFLTQVVGMMLNNAVYFLFWVIFFDRFEQVRGWQLGDMFVLFGLVASGFGLAAFLFGNVLNLAEVIRSGRLDYYLALPQPVLIHALASRPVTSGLGDALYGLISFLLAGEITPGSLGRFLLGVLISLTIFLSFMVSVHSLAFWLGSAQLLSEQALQAVLTFSLYPITLFDGTAKFALFTLVPAAFIGALPAEFVRAFTWGSLGQLAAGAVIFLGLALGLFHAGLRRYESGSAIQTQI